MVVLSAFLFSCGNGSNEENKDEQNDNVTGEYTSEDGLITAKLPNGWNNDGTGPNTFKVYSYIMENTGDIHKDIVSDYLELLDEVKEVKVDNLPALTKKEKFQQNKEMISRTWLVYNGTDIICIVVQSEEPQWDDNVAKNIASLIKINKRKDNVKLPAPIEKEKYIRPESFPELVAESFKDYYLDKPAILSVENIEKSLKIYIVLKELGKEKINYEDEAQMAVLDSIVTANGLENSEVFIKTIKIAYVAFDLINGFSKLDKLETDTESYKISFEILKSMIEQTKICKEDIIFVSGVLIG